MARSYKKTIVLGLDYSEFSGGITECNNKMKLLDSEFALAQAQMGENAKASDQYALKTEYLTEKINLQQAKVEAAKKKYNALMDAHADTTKIDKADAALLRERTQLEKLKTELEQTRIAQSGLKESALALATVLGTIITGLGKCAKDVAEYADNIQTLSDQTSISTDTLQEWEYASNLVDVSLETMTGSIQKMEKNMLSASKGTGEAAKAFNKLGVKVTDSNGEMRGAEEVYYNVIDALRNVKNATEQDQLAMSIFGKSAADLTGVINAGSEGMKAYGKEAQELGRVLGTEEIAKALALSDAMDRMNRAFESVENELGLLVIPMITDLLEKIAAIPTPVLKSIAVIASIVVTLMTLVKVINSVTAANRAINAVMKLTEKGLSATMLKIAAIIALITTLTIGIVTLTGKNKEFNRSMTSVVSAATGKTPYNRTGYNASGTQNWRGGTTWVGEHGPEIVDLPPGSKIYSNNETKNIAGDKNYYITINADVSKLRSVSEVVDMVEGLNMSYQGGA